MDDRRMQNTGGNCRIYGYKHKKSATGMDISIGETSGNEMADGICQNTGMKKEEGKTALLFLHADIERIKDIMQNRIETSMRC